MLDSARVLLTFPCAFPVKAIGRHSADFEMIVADIVRRHAPDLQPEAVTSRSSGSGTYLAVTVTIVAHSREQLDALYRDLNRHEQVLMVL